MARITLRLPEETYRMLRSTSTRCGVSLNQFIVSALSEALARREPDVDQEDSQIAKVRRLRIALGDLLVDPSEVLFPEYADRTDPVMDHDTLARSLPHLDPPLSASIIEDREDRLI